MRTSFPFEQISHIPGIYRKEIPEKKRKEWLLSLLERSIHRRNNFSSRDILVKTLQKQYGGKETGIVSEAIRKLENKNAFTVTTGHQLNIFGGPLFFFYKIISTIRLARDLKTEFPDKEFIPVFWMASEDHDYEEIKSFHLFGKTITWETSQEGAVGRFTTAGTEELLRVLESLKGNMEYAAELIGIFSEAYAPGNSLSAATRILVDKIFGKQGLVVIDGDDPELKRLFIPVIKKEILEQPSVNIVNATNEMLISEGYSPQVHPREINFFYLEKNSRKRIVLTGAGKFAVHEGEREWNREDLIMEIEEHPENFSPNVLMRPLYQETVLPNLAYIGGPGEISYWKQLDDVFEFFGMPYPVLIPRHSVLLIDKSQESRMQKLNISEKDLFLPVDELIRNFITEVAGEETDLGKFKEDLRSVFEELSEKTEKVDQTLKPGVLAELQKEIKYIESLEARLRKSEKNRNETSVNQIRQLREKLFPEGVPQERFDSVISFYWKYGQDGIEYLINDFDPFDWRYRVIYS